jgi:imidazoleglycerol-phosphate dehydratase
MNLGNGLMRLLQLLGEILSPQPLEPSQLLRRRERARRFSLLDDPTFGFLPMLGRALISKREAFLGNRQLRFEAFEMRRQSISVGPKRGIISNRLELNLEPARFFLGGLELVAQAVALAVLVSGSFPKLLEHMLELFAKHGLFDLQVTCNGDLEIDDHHSVEDIAITLGQALVQALGDKSGINRYGEAVVPMDEALCRSVIDLSGRFYLVYEVPTRRQMIGNFSVELAEHFWRSLAETAKFNLHIDCLRGRNTHHILEGTFKASARALRQAVERNSRITGVPSTKGSL